MHRVTNPRDDRAGLPEAFAPLFVPLADPTPMEVERRRLLRIGSSGSQAICLDQSSGEIVSIASLSPRSANDRWQSPRLMNRDMEAFKACLDAARLALAEGSSDDSDDVARAIRKRLQQLDPAAMSDRDGFWSTFCDDVALGDWSDA